MMKFIVSIVVFCVGAVPTLLMLWGIYYPSEGEKWAMFVYMALGGIGGVVFRPRLQRNDGGTQAS